MGARQVVGGVAALAMVVGGVSAGAEATYRQAEITYEARYARDCASHLTDQPQINVNIIDPSCEKVNSSLITEIHRDFLPTLYDLPAVSEFVAEQSTLDAYRRQQFGHEVFEFGLGGIAVGALAAMAIVEFWRRNQREAT